MQAFLPSSYLAFKETYVCKHLRLSLSPLLPSLQVDLLYPGDIRWPAGGHRISLFSEVIISYLPYNIGQISSSAVPHAIIYTLSIPKMLMRVTHLFIFHYILHQNCWWSLQVRISQNRLDFVNNLGGRLTRPDPLTFTTRGPSRNITRPVPQILRKTLQSSHAEPPASTQRHISFHSRTVS